MIKNLELRQSPVIELNMNINFCLSKYWWKTVMKNITRDEFCPSIVVDELPDGAGVVMLEGVFFQKRRKRISETLVAETDEAIDTGFHFNQNDQDPLL